MIIRLANNNDFDQLIRMRWDFTNEYNEHKIEENQYNDFYLECMSFLTEAINNNKWFIWVADLDGQIISHIYIELIFKVPRPGRKTNPFTYMTNVYTLPEHRGKGIGSQLLKEIEVWAKINKYEFIIVWPSERSIEFYERNGYKHCNEPMELMLE
ncbi:acetyltransferase [Paenibacillus oryzae]|uniref:Acetyltransferase n=1 Tax=Paenibacillus oryzae TaxID=1844972 RepID=A0A1A5YTI1_9BACL|nr:GNAT family N-acetyltransferase [Paenibacillus oryzae]OBR68941.1 acetyltransferase [Paenibacillus oryzae]